MEEQDDPTTSWKQEEKKMEVLDWDLSAKLYDRDAQQKALKDAYSRRRRYAKTSEFVLITGASGTGKSALAGSLRRRVEDDWGFFVSGKFDDKMQKPHAPFISAVEEFIRQVQLRGDYVVDMVREAITEAIGAELYLLYEAVPQLKDLMEVKGQPSFLNESMRSLLDASDFQLSMGDEHDRFASVFCRFLRAICCSERPLVLLLDDVQWIDASSLRVLKSLLNPDSEEEINMEGLMVIGTCRGNEVACDHDLAVMLRHIEDRGTTINEIQVDNLDVLALSCMISSALDLTEAECTPLAEIIHSQTEGNVFFAKQYMKALVEDGLLHKDVKGKWAWDESALLIALPSNSTTKDEVIIQLLAKKLQQLPEVVVDTVKVISCLGSKFSEEVLFHTGTVVSSQLFLALEAAAKHGFIVYDVSNCVGHFTHDKFREAAYHLIAEEDRPLFHLTLGRNLRRQLSLARVKANIIWIANQIKYGLALVEDPDEKDDFARLYLRAAREAARVSAFALGFKYVETGIELLSKRCWRDQYELSLDLYSTGAELAYCSGRNDKVNEMAKEVVNNARATNDRSRVIMTQIIGYGALGRVEAGIRLSLDALKELGEPFPRRNGRLRSIFEFYETKRALGNKTEEDILNLPKLEDPRVEAAMKIILIMFPLVALSDVRQSPIPGFRLVRLTLKHGLSPLAAVAFNIYSTCLIRVGEVEEGYRWAQLANVLLERFPSRQLKGKLMFMFWAVHQVLKEPLRSVLSPIWKAHQFSLRTGDIELALASRTFHDVFRVYLGDPIVDVVKSLTKTDSLSVSYGHSKIHYLVTSTLQFCNNLQGCSKDRLALRGEHCDEEKAMQEMKGLKINTAIAILLHYKFVLAAIFNENYVADDIFRSNGSFFQEHLFPFISIYHVFFRGLVSAALARDSTGLARRRRVAETRKHLKTLHARLIHCPENIINKICLIEAELEYGRQRYSAALLKYKKAISYAQREKFHVDEAVGNEKCGVMLLSAGRKSEAIDCLKRARSLYETWGAKAKVDQIDNLLVGRLVT